MQTMRLRVEHLPDPQSLAAATAEARERKDMDAAKGGLYHIRWMNLCIARTDSQASLVTSIHLSYRLTLLVVDLY